MVFRDLACLCSTSDSHHTMHTSVQEHVWCHLQFRFRPPRVLTPGTVEDTRVPLVSSTLHLVCVVAMDSYLILTWNYLALQMGSIIVFLGVTMAIYTIVAVLLLWAFQQMAKAWGPPPSSNLLHIQSTESGSRQPLVV